MLYIFMGQSCTGKSTASEKVKEVIQAEIYTGKDYLRLAKNEAEAWKLFYEKLVNAAKEEVSQENIIFIITEVAMVNRVSDIEGAVFVKFDASIETIKNRFAKRTNGKLSPAIETMLSKQYEQWKSIKAMHYIDTDIDNELNIEELKLISLH